MATDEPYVRRSVKELAAGLKGDEMGRVAVTSMPSKPIVKPKIDRSGAASVPPPATRNSQPSNLPNGDPAGEPATPVLPPRRPGQRPPPPSAPPRRANGEGNGKPAVPNLPPRRPTDGPSLPPRQPSGGPPVATNGTAAGPSPSLPPRQSSDRPALPNRRDSQASVASTTSAVSSISKLSTQSGRTNGRTASTGDQPRVRAPVFDPASLPPLPPKREKKEEQDTPPPKLPSRGKSISNMLSKVRNEPSVPALPTRPGSAAPDQPPRRLPPTAIPPARPRPEVSNGHANGTNGVSNGVGQPAQAQGPGVVELTIRNFDSVVLNSGKPALVMFSANFCKYCKAIEPVYAELGNDLRHASDQVTVAKLDCAVQKTLGSRYDINAWPTFKWFDGTGGPPQPYQYSWDYEGFANFIEEMTGAKASKELNSAPPPPVPSNTKPDLSKLLATKPKPAHTAAGGAANGANGTAATSTPGCLTCRDFSGPDQHAAKFPRQNVRSVDELARDLTSPFSTATDKARAIFTWMHHNIAYDCPSFFGGNVRHMTALETLQSGLAVCAGYAGLYADLALKAGLECVVVGGHGKGFGYTALKPGEPVPPEKQGHAWNAVKIDSGGVGGNGQMYWKLLDACWGAGSVSGQSYTAGFKPEQFTMTNIDFGRTHFPEDRSKQFRSDGRIVSWQEYYVGENGGEGPTVFSNIAPREGISKFHMLPKLKHISIDPNAHAETNGIVRFQFQRVCDHFKPEMNGLDGEMLFVVPTAGGRKKIPFETNGTYWWCDVDVRQLGKPGDDVLVMTVDSMGGKNGRRMTRDEYLRLQAKGNGSGGSGLACWKLV